MSVVRRPLAGCMMNCSVSESEDSAGRGFPTWQVNRVTVQIVSALFGQGAGVVFGHDWREDGVMEAIHGFAQQIQPPVPLSPEQARAESQPMLWNFVPWPDHPRLSADDLKRLESTLRVQRAGLPSELEAHALDAERAGPDNHVFRYVRARGLTHLRHRLNAVSQARLCLGGRTSGFAGRYPGVVEEAFLALRAGLPLYLTGLLGGATRQIIDAITMPGTPSAFGPEVVVAGLYATPPVVEVEPATQADREVDPPAVWRAFGQAGVRTLAEANGLSVEENEQLFSTTAVDTVVQLVLTGLGRLRAADRL